MGKRLQNIRERFGIPSGRAIIHIVIVQLAIQGIWSWVSRMFTIALVREIGFLVLFVAGLVIVAWYLPKIAPVFSGAIARRTASTQGTVDIQYPTQVRDALDALIQRGEDLCSKMQTKDFSRWHLEPIVGEWLDDVNKEVWKEISEHASYIVGEQGDLTDDEKLRYQGWNWGNVALRISVDRRLARLREIYSQIQNRGKGSMVKPQVSSEIQKLADQMTKAIQRDINNFTRCIFVHNTSVDWQHLVDTDSYFEIHCDIYNSSVFEIDIGESADGHIRYEDAELERPIEVRTPIKKLRRSNIEHLVLRQWVSQSMMNRIALDGGNEIRLFFNGINIWVEARQLDSHETPKCRLPIPHELQVRIPTQVELKNL